MLETDRLSQASTDLCLGLVEVRLKHMKVPLAAKSSREEG